jgi:hypothetical protein
LIKKIISDIFRRFSGPKSFPSSTGTLGIDPGFIFSNSETNSKRSWKIRRYYPGRIGSLSPNWSYIDSYMYVVFSFLFQAGEHIWLFFNQCKLLKGFYFAMQFGQTWALLNCYSIKRFKKVTKSLKLSQSELLTYYIAQKYLTFHVHTYCSEISLKLFANQ